MPPVTISGLTLENTNLREQMAKLEGQLANQPGLDGELTDKESVELYRSRTAMHASEARYRRLFESAQDGILILNVDSGVIEDSNPYLENLLGYSHDELAGKTLWELGLFHDIAASRLSFASLLHSNYCRYENLPLETKDKIRLNVEFISCVYLVGGIRVAQCIIRDIAARRLDEIKMREVNTELQTFVTELQRKDSELDSLNKMSDLLQACNTQQEAYEVIALMAAKLFNGVDGCLSVPHNGDHDLEVVACWGAKNRMKSNFAMNDCWAIRRGEPHEALNLHADMLCSHFVDKPRNSYICIPLSLRGEFLGLLSVIAKDTATTNDMSRLRFLSVALGNAIKLSLFNLRLREQLSEQATRDPLTGLFNRRYLEDSLNRELHRAKREQSPLSIVMLDLDYFKQFNDAYGHDAGDQLLCELGKLLQSVLRKSDISCRYGGEEFVLVLPDSSTENTWKCIDKIRILIKGLKVRRNNLWLGPVTVSAGIATAPEHGSTTPDLLRSADDAMYAAKKAGRDCLVICEAKS